MSTDNTQHKHKHYVSFGNPSLGTYNGIVYTQDSLQSSNVGEDEICSMEHSNDGEEEEDNLRQTKKPIDCKRIVAMIDVPPDQVPEGILMFARAHRPLIKHVRIVTSMKEESPSLDDSTTTSNEYEESFPLSSLFLQQNRPCARLFHSQDEDDDDDDDDEFCRRKDKSRTYLILFELSSAEAASTFVKDLNGKPYTSLQDDILCTVHHVLALKGEGGISLIGPFFAPNAAVVESSDVPSHTNLDTQQPQTRLPPTSHHNHADTQNCAVCLDLLDAHASSILTTLCNHTFHIDCLLRWQDSPCPVCRYDHSGLNDALSRCHVCGTTENNYVCLICGVVSCVDPPLNSVCEDDSFDSYTFPLHQPSTAGSRPVCRSGHARDHYVETLHAYALDIETQHVWDFAGDGFVHRLIQNKDDGKLVEVTDPLNTSNNERSLRPGLTDAQEGEVVHRKLERYANQYYTLLKSQLEQQRIFYEAKLEEIRRQHALEYQTDGVNSPQRKAGGTTADLIAALKQDRNQLEQRRLTLDRKHSKLSKEVEFLKNMNESLEINKISMQRQICDAKKEREQARLTFLNCLPPLEEKVKILMYQLECGDDSSFGEMKSTSSDGDDRKPAAKKRYG